MLFAAYGIFLMVTAAAFSLAAAGQRPKPEGSPLRVVTLFISVAILVFNIGLVPEQHGATSLGTLIVSGAVVGSALFAIGAAAWTGTAAFWLRAVGWLVLSIEFAIPSTLTLGLPLVAVLAFAVVPISRWQTNERPRARSITA